MAMNLQLLLFSIVSFSLLFLISSVTQVQGGRHQRLRPKRLFVFGDSYVDTGNAPKSVAGSWKQPYGITFPGKPAGRFSDGRVFTDYVARFIGAKSPIPYRWRKYAGIERLKHGMNFAIGGAGVFDTIVPLPNMSQQIDLFHNVTHRENLYTAGDLHSSAALISVGGNDYLMYLAVNGSIPGFPEFISKVVKQLTMEMRRLSKMEVKKIAVTALPPFGCVPFITSSSSFKKCNGTLNQLVSFHNLLLQKAVAKLNADMEKGQSTFLILDLFSAFMNVFNKNGLKPGSSKFEDPLKPCCVGKSSAYSCGDVNANGTKMYTVCDHPLSAFFWDSVHPTQQAWLSVYLALQPNLHLLFN